MISQALLSRLKYELNLFEKDPPPGIQAWATSDRVDQLEATIIGPESTPYYKGIFKLEIIMPNRYPFEPPKVKFITPIYHPNVDNNGRICLDTLNMPPKGAWAPSLNISTVLQTIRVLMSEPNPYDPLMQEITEEFKNNHPQFLKTAESWTKKYATGDDNNKDISNNESTVKTTTTTTATNNYSNKREREDENENNVNDDDDNEKQPPVKINRFNSKDEDQESKEENEKNNNKQKDEIEKEEEEEEEEEDDNDGW